MWIFHRLIVIKYFRLGLFYIKSKAYNFYIKFLFSAKSVKYIDFSDKTLNFIIKCLLVRISRARVLSSGTLAKSCIS